MRACNDADTSALRTALALFAASSANASRPEPKSKPRRRRHHRWGEAAHAVLQLFRSPGPAGRRFLLPAGAPSACRRPHQRLPLDGKIEPDFAGGRALLQDTFFRLTFAPEARVSIAASSGAPPHTLEHLNILDRPSDDRAHGRDRRLERVPGVGGICSFSQIPRRRSSWTAVTWRGFA